MNEETLSEKQEELEKLLKDLSQQIIDFSEDGVFHKYFSRFETIYLNKENNSVFRHSYAGIFEILSQLHTASKESNRPDSGSLETLLENLKTIKEEYEPTRSSYHDYYIDVSQNLIKLYDHINLDFSRITYYEAIQKNINAEKISESLNNLESKTALIDEQNKSLTTKLSNLQLENITILGIFAAVVLTFTGGLSFSTSVFESMAELSIYRVSALILLLGITLMNILFSLFHYIDRLTNPTRKPILKPFIIGNGVLIALLTVIIIMRYNNCFITT